MQLTNFNLRQKLWLLVIPAIFYLLLLTIMVVSQQYLLIQNQQYTENFLVVNFLLIIPTILITLLMIWVAAIIRHSFVPLLTHSQALAQGDTALEIKSQGSDETLLLQCYAKIQKQLHDKQYMIDYYQRMLDELKRVFAALAAGNLDENVTSEYTGDLASLKTDINNALKQLRTAITDINVTTDAAAKDMLDKRIDLTDKQGFFKSLKT